ncbi:MAG TPA: nucleotide exchange factor GrpE [Nitrospirae bacterium]|nr:heat shock protein GrpE [bacterium BMS3Abin09]GBE40364.1 heat shock protein GrpE [bacterium BMS3Bbin09]HDH33840.1 nucleotide exchange factor GrpE [Nitrospirota bacterium]HDN94650.1 nucleotide exchange factor GrpE [Nitrospirota bacterium]HDO67322.1 nucleotide exchange factor GrpE [Nitrospirota bacterium]
MTEGKENDLTKSEEENVQEPQETETENENEEAPSEVDEKEDLKKSLGEANDKYVRLYADFENYKKIAARNKEELLKYANDDLMSDVLTVIDHLELALQHTGKSKGPNPLAEGVELTLKELRNILDKHGLVTIDSLGKPFDPSVHHAMSQVETEDAKENTVVKEFRKGYKLKDRILRASMVGVAKKPAASEEK